MDNKKIICLMGPTASGKTAAALELAATGLYEIISVDSAMIYRGMDIGTAKPSVLEQSQAPHRLIDIRDPKEHYSVAEFIEDAAQEINDILAQNKTPLLVGGTMMYFYQLQQGLDILPSSSPTIRERVTQEALEKGWPDMHAILSQVDPSTAAKLHPNDAQRISRALEVYYQTEKPLSVWREERGESFLPYEFTTIILAPERKFLHDRIEKRFDLMLTQGFLAEVERLYKRGDLHANLSSIRSVGYRQAWDYLAGNVDFKTMREQAIIATRQLCKRQLTWLRRFRNARWLTAWDHNLL